MNRESIAELNAIETPLQNRSEVLQLRLHHLMREKRWARGQPQVLPGLATLQRRICPCWLEWPLSSAADCDNVCRASRQDARGRTRKSEQRRALYLLQAGKICLKKSK
jgi:hypothetical protein